MKKSINDFRTMFTKNEILTTTQLSTIKGGNGDDKRRDDLSISTTIFDSTTTLKTTKPSGK